jgi:hypothetical protein
MPIGQAKFGLLGGVADLGKLELIETQTYSSAVSFVDFTSIQESTYNVHFMTINNLQTPSSVTHNNYFRLYESGVLETASVYQYARQSGNAGGSFSEPKSTSTTGMDIEFTFSDQLNQNGYAYFYNLGDSSKYSFATYHFYTTRTSDSTMTFGSAVLPQASTVDGIRLLTTSGNFTDFDISLYGIAES